MLMKIDSGHLVHHWTNELHCYVDNQINDRYKWNAYDMSNFIDVIYIQENISVLNQSKTNHNVEGCFDVFEPIQS